MSVTVQIDEQLWKAAESATDIHDPNELVRKLIERELASRAANRRLADAGGSMPDLVVPPRLRNSAKS